MPPYSTKIRFALYARCLQDQWPPGAVIRLSILAVAPLVAITPAATGRQDGAGWVGLAIMLFVALVYPLLDYLDQRSGVGLWLATLGLGSRCLATPRAS